MIKVRVGDFKIGEKEKQAINDMLESGRISEGEKVREFEKRGVETRPLFGSIPTQQPAYQHLKGRYKGKLPNADYVGLNGFYIGCHQYLEQGDLDYVVNTFKEILR